MSVSSERKSAVVLIVEDEMWVMLDIAESLEEHGFTALRARNGDEALQLFRSSTGIEAVFTDINMPGEIDGLQLAHELRRRRPDLALLVTTGRYREENLSLPAATHFIPKPYEPKVVISSIETLLSRGSSNGCIERSRTARLSDCRPAQWHTSSN